MNIVTINGSARIGNYTGKALALMQGELREMQGVTVTGVEPAKLNLSVPGLAVDSSASRDLQELVTPADGIVMATPEYHGSFSSLIKTTIENLGFPSVLKGKPIALLGVAGGRIGAIKSLEHLRSVCSHVGALVLPRTVSVSGVRAVFDEEGKCLDEKIGQQIRALASELVNYVHEAHCPEISFEERIRD